MKYLFSIMIAIIMFSCTQKKDDGYIVKGNIEGLDTGKIILSYFDRENYKSVKVDSAIIESGKFEMKGKLQFPQELYAHVTPGGYSFSIWLENSKINIKGSIDDVEEDEWGEKQLPVTIDGSSIQAELDTYSELKKPIMDEMLPFGEAYGDANMEYSQGMRQNLPEDELEELKKKAEDAKERMNPFFERMNKIDIKYMDEHPGSFVTAKILQSKLSKMKAQEAQKKYELLSDEVKNSFLGKSIKNDIDKNMLGTPGNVAAQFSKEDINGEILSLEDFKGQYVLLDFWASWCKPCRQGNPHLIKLYNKYHEKGVEFIGIANDDGNESAWHKAVKKDEIGIWRHILNGNSRQGNDIGNKYAIHSLPTKILIDPSGVIIGRYGADGDDDEAMDRKFEEIFKY